MSDGFSFVAQNVHVHHYPEDAPKWSEGTKKQIDENLNNNREEKIIVISGKTLKINDYEFSGIKKVGISIPLFKKKCAMVFGARCQDFDAHVHVTTKGDDFIENFIKLLRWREQHFPNSLED